jgi:hypothetical protein
LGSDGEEEPPNPDPEAADGPPKPGPDGEDEPPNPETGVADGPSGPETGAADEPPKPETGADAGAPAPLPGTPDAGEAGRIAGCGGVALPPVFNALVAAGTNPAMLDIDPPPVDWPGCRRGRAPAETGPAGGTGGGAAGAGGALAGCGLCLPAQFGSTETSAGLYGATCSGTGGVFAIGVRTGSGALRSWSGPRGSSSGRNGTTGLSQPGVAIADPVPTRVGSTEGVAEAGGTGGAAAAGGTAGAAGLRGTSADGTAGGA